jgi:membrane-associated phospholipid phosphatase
LFFLGYFYAETGYLNNLILNDLDPFIKHYEQLLFGCQPSIEFSKLFPQTWFNELMNFGYFSYYFLTVTVCLTIFIVRPKEYQFTIFIIITSFFIYYIIFIIFPVIGPQFYFPAPLSKIPDAGFFRDGVKFAQHIGEQPTGAFPSSHVGMALIFLYISYNNYRKLFLLILPFVIILFFATVYIKAHYLVDVIGGFVSSPLVLFISIKMYKLFYKHEKA